MTAMLVSGGKGLLAGVIAGLIFNKAGVLVDKYILGNKEYYDVDNKKQRKEKNNV